MTDVHCHAIATD